MILMPSPKIDEYLEKILREIKYKPDRMEIKLEIENHILDKMDYYLSKGKDLDDAEELALISMGDGTSIGRALNREHNFLLGIIYHATSLILMILSFFTILFLSIYIFSGFFPNTVKMDKEDIAYEQVVNQERTIDNNIVRIKKLVISKDGQLIIYYEKRLKNPLRNVWGNSYIGEIYDDFGQSYLGGGYFSTGFMKNVGNINIDNFNMESKNIIIDYDLYKRKYKIVIPLKVGDSIE